MISSAIDPINVWDAGFAAGMVGSWNRPNYDKTEMSMLWGNAWMCGQKVALNFKGTTQELASEHAHQVALFDWADYASQLRPDLKLMYAIPNAGKRSKAVGAMMKAEGLKPGFPDVCLPVPKYGSGALYIEMKKIKGRVEKNQSEWIEKLNFAGNSAVACFGFDAARQAVCDYLTFGTEND